MCFCNAWWWFFSDRWHQLSPMRWAAVSCCFLPVICWCPGRSLEINSWLTEINRDGSCLWVKVIYFINLFYMITLKSSVRFNEPLLRESPYIIKSSLSSFMHDNYDNIHYHLWNWINCIKHGQVTFHPEMKRKNVHIENKACFGRNYCTL